MDNKKIKIAFFLPTLGGGGAERNVVNLVNNLDRKKYTPYFVLGKVKGVFINKIPKEISIIDLDSSSNLGLFFKLIRYFHKEQPDVFVSAFPNINIISIIARIFSGAKTKIVITEQNTLSLFRLTARNFTRRLIARFLLPYLVRFIYPRADVIVCVSKGVADDLSEIIRSPKEIRVIYNPVVEKRIYDLAEESIEHPWFSDKKTPIILAVGRLVKAKDYPNLFQTFALILKKQPVHLVVLGRGSEKTKLERLSQKLGISENIAFLGFQENPFKYMARASIFVLSSFQEGFGNVLVEAMACGTPVISTNCKSGPSEIIEDGKSGILVPVADQEALAAAIFKVLNNPSLDYKLSEQGKKRAEHFSIGKSVKKYEEIFDKLQE